MSAKVGFAPVTVPVVESVRNFGTVAGLRLVVGLVEFVPAAGLLALVEQAVTTADLLAAVGLGGSVMVAGSEPAVASMGFAGSTVELADSRAVEQDTAVDKPGASAAATVVQDTVVVGQDSSGVDRV